MNFLDLFFPKTCVGCGKLGTYFCQACVSAFSLALPICPVCRKGSIGGATHTRCRREYGLDGLVSVFYYQAAIQEAVKRLKYRFVREMGEAFVEVALAKVDPETMAFFQRKNFRVVPVPLSRSRERWRGFNQAELLGKILAGRMGLPFVSWLRRVKDTQALAELRVRLTQEERQELSARYLSTTQRMMAERRLLGEKKAKARAEQMRGAFEISEKLKVKSSKLLLVDDVWTSGATMGECVKVLKRNGAFLVWGFTFARSGGAF